MIKYSTTKKKKIKVIVTATATTTIIIILRCFPHKAPMAFIKSLTRNNITPF